MANVKAMRDAVKAQILSQLMSKFEADGQDVGISGSEELAGRRGCIQELPAT